MFFFGMMISPLPCTVWWSHNLSNHDLLRLGPEATAGAEDPSEPETDPLPGNGVWGERCVFSGASQGQRLFLPAA